MGYYKFSDQIRSCTSWTDARTHFLAISEQERGRFFEELVKLFLLVDPQYATLLSDVWLLEEVPISVAQELRLPDGDRGIDIICRTRENEYWAVQCKYRSDEDQALTWDELATFSGLAFGVCSNISFGLICTTAERVTAILSNLPNVGFCAGDIWRSLDDVFFSLARDTIGGTPSLPRALTPRPHQIRAMNNALRHYVADGQARGKMIQPCGTGKSLTSYWIAEKLESKRTLVIVPSLALIRQTLRVWLTESYAKQRTIAWLCVCSDESAGDPARDDSVVYTHDIGVPCYSRTADIANWLKLHSQHEHVIVFCTYQSGKALARAARDFAFDFGVFDEAHKTVGRSGKLFSHLLSNENLLINRRLFMTATERRYTGADNTILSMDDPALYGETFEMLSFKHALEESPPILTDYRVVVIAVEATEVERLIRSNQFVYLANTDDEHAVEARSIASLISLRKAMSKYDCSHAITFHRSIRGAQRFQSLNAVYADIVDDGIDVSAFHVSGRVAMAKRERIISDFLASPQSYISNARCLSEGVDIPKVDSVLFVDPRKSTVDIVQALGRALRPFKGKAVGHVIVPVIVKKGQRLQDLENDSDFQEVISVLRALASQDDRIIDYFRPAPQKANKSNPIVEYNIEPHITQEIHLHEFLRAVDTICWDKLGRLAWRPFEDAREFARSLNLSGLTHWRTYTREGLPGKPKLPADIPSSPWLVYANRGWLHIKDWLGRTGKPKRPSSWKQEWRSFSEAREFARKLGLSRGKDWTLYASGLLSDLPPLPPDIPAIPGKVYAEDGWQGIRDWLGVIGKQSRSGYSHKSWRSFEEARAFAHTLGLRGVKEWRDYCNGERPDLPSLPNDIPITPTIIYDNQGWKGWPDFLGPKWRPFEEARAFVHTLGLRLGTEWRDYCNGERPDLPSIPGDIPMTPNSVYIYQSWKGWPDFLGPKWRPFEEARAFVHTLGLGRFKEWQDYCNGERPDLPPRPRDIPVSPGSVYEDQGWNGWADFLGHKWRSFEEARAFAHTLGLRGVKEWRDYCNGERPDLPSIPGDIPMTPISVYIYQGWKGMADWLGYMGETISEASPNVTSKELPIPLTDSGGNVGDSISVSHSRTATFGESFRSFQEARQFSRSLGLKSRQQWPRYCKGRIPELPPLPRDIPWHPMDTYVHEWVSMDDWLGIEK